MRNLCLIYCVMSCCWSLSDLSSAFNNLTGVKVRKYHQPNVFKGSKVKGLIMQKNGPSQCFGDILAADSLLSSFV